MKTLVIGILFFNPGSLTHKSAGAQALSGGAPAGLSGQRRNDLDCTEHRHILQGGRTGTCHAASPASRSFSKSAGDIIWQAECLRRQWCAGRSLKAGDWCDDGVGLIIGVRWLPVELLAERGVTVDHVTIYRWVQRFTPEFIEAARS